MIAVEGEPVGSSEELTAVDTHDPGDTITVEVVRGGSSAELEGHARQRLTRRNAGAATARLRPRRTGAAVFDSIGWGEIIVLGLAALFIFGPERLPTLAKDAAAGLKKVRAAITGVREQVNESLGTTCRELRDLDLRKYHPEDVHPQPVARRRRRPDARELDRSRRPVPPRLRPAAGPRDAAPVRPRRDLARCSATPRTRPRVPRRAPLPPKSASRPSAAFSRARVPSIPCRLLSRNSPTDDGVGDPVGREMSKVSVTVVPPSAVGASS